MVEHPIRLIVSDIDGTILDDRHQVDPDLKELIPRLREEVIPFVLASARSPLGMEPIAQELGLDKQPLASYNGALVIQGGADHYQIIIQHPLDQEELQVVIQTIQDRCPQLAINLYSGVNWTASQLNKWVQQEADITGERPRIQELQPTDLADLSPVHKLLLIDEPAVIQELQAYLLSLELDKTAFYLSKDNYLEITDSQVSKEKALVEVARYYRIPLEQTMAIGDNFNDLPMLRLAGLGVAMGNAPQAVKEEADTETSSNKQHGVAKAIKKYVFKERN